MLRTFDAAAVARLTPYPALVDALAAGLAEPIVSPPRAHFDPLGDGSAFLIMPAWQTGGLIGVKMVSVWPANAAAGKPTVTALYNVFSCADGMPVAVIDGTELTLRRTAAAAALAARLLARRGRLRLAVLGTGALAPELAEAHAAVLDLDAITVWGRNPAHAQAVVARLGARGIAAAAEPELAAAVSGADVIVAATTATAPFIAPEWVRPGTHLGLVGAFTATMAEAAPALLPRATLYADNRAAVLEKGGEVTQAVAAGLITPAAVRAELAEMVGHGAAWRAGAAEITVFKSVGFAALDLLAARQVLAAAE
ncbi:MAG: ornithine cyclodeaminase family protein [Burkholderiales bacterium]|nr:ornithine cyclodeaminase family protein [Burkholderiales bacterium]